MNAVITSLVLLSLVGLGYSWKYPRNADQTLWAFKTCQREGTNDALVKIWKNWILPNDAETHCYVRCVWIHLGMFNEKENSIRVKRVGEQFTGRGVNVPNMKSLKGSARTCKEVYDKTMPFFANNVNDIKTAFYGKKEVSDQWFKDHTDTKPKGIKISSFCKDGDREKGKEGNCQHACSAYYYRLVDEDNEPISFRKLGRVGVSDDEFSKCINKVKGLSGCKVADAMYNCVNDHNAQALKKLDEESEKY
uniref:D7-like protein n=1 Tax=Phlebotomus duboscqi TaxID=37738 RepID=Q06K55_PHLDU|nr:D7-like protein [Phlebotomus duboscqi]